MRSASWFQRGAPRTDRFWILNLALAHLGYWYYQNAAGRSYYRQMRRAGRS
jgi:hypothetical protein